MKNIIALMPVVILIVVAYYLFKISAILAISIILLALIIVTIKLLKTSSLQFDAIKERSCYKCGAKMVLKTAQMGKYEGKKFYGCSKYPNCDCMIDINGKPISLFY